MVYHIDEWHFAYFYTTRNEGVYYDIYTLLLLLTKVNNIIAIIKPNLDFQKYF